MAENDKAQFGMRVSEWNARAEAARRAGTPVSDANLREAMRVYQETGRMSISWLQRKLGWGFNLASAVCMVLEESGKVSLPYQNVGKHSSAR